MASRRPRPTAFEVSFPDDVKKEEEERKKKEEDEQEKRRLESVLASQLGDKRKRNMKAKVKAEEKEREREALRRRVAEEEGLKDFEEDEEVEFVDERPRKRIQLEELPTQLYVSQPNEIKETATTFLEGEDELDSDSDSDSDSDVENIQQQQKKKQKPIRLLTHFIVFDSRHRNEYVSLSSLEEEDGVDRRFEVVGWVVPYYVAHQADVEEDDDLNGEERGDEDIKPVYMRIGPVIRWSMKYTDLNEPIYIETPHAWYMLKMPAQQYRRWYQVFYRPRRIAQLVISNGIKRPQLGFRTFVDMMLLKSRDILGNPFEEEDISIGAELIRDAIDEVDATLPNQNIRKIPVIAHILRNAPPRRTQIDNAELRRRNIKQNHLQIPFLRSKFAGTGNPDIGVLKSENQTITHITPFIASIARGYFHERIKVVGPPPPDIDEVAEEKQRRKVRGLLWKWIERAKGGLLESDWKREDKINARSNYLKRIYVGGEIYQVGDFVIVPHGKYGKRDPPEWPKDIKHLPDNATAPRYFWFGRIMYIKNEEQIVHLQWLEHGSQTMLQELANPQELFFCNLCDPVPWGAIIAKVDVQVKPTGTVKPHEYYAKFIQDKTFANFIAIDKNYQTHLERYGDYDRRDIRSTLDYCPSCIAMDEDEEKLSCHREKKPRNRNQNQNQNQNEGQNSNRDKNKENEDTGLVFGGQTYHVFDFILYRSEKGPAHIGQVLDIQYPVIVSNRKPVTIKVRKLGRVWDLVGFVGGAENELKDERHVFMTDETTTIPYTDLINKCLVISRETFGQRIAITNWLDASPYHFYICYHFKKLTPTSWEQRTRIAARELMICKQCTEKAVQGYYDMRRFRDEMEKKPLRVLDIFGGTGAFSLGLKEGTGQCLQISHAVEISPSTAKTFQRNNPETKVINQCVNTVLQYAIKKHSGHAIIRPSQLWDNKTPIPEPPNVSDIDVITAGFPCQTHSRLNMFRTAHDVKSNLMLNALSWVEFYRPKFVYMENVSGFLSYNLNAQQAGRHTLEGGIPMGGLKLLIRALLDMDYQVRYSLLQAGHYGTPQRRVRFFLIAALSHTKENPDEILPLPELPQPTHDFPQSHKLQVNLTTGDIVRPIRWSPGTAAHPFVSIEDAIGDLQRFDWKRPGSDNRNIRQRPRYMQERDDIPSLICDHKEACCGYKGSADYHCAPQTAYQKRMRVKPCTDLQHFTKTVKARKVDRVLAIPLNPGADYRSLTADLSEWQFMNPASSIARLNYKPGCYGRLDKNNCFPTIVTNIDPMAKQSRVLHPYCKRMLTVRELARAQGFPDYFFFEAFRGNVVVMHRQIGNAVPLPLAQALGRELRETLFKEWSAGRKVNPSRIDDEHDSDEDSNEGLYA